MIRLLIVTVAVMALHNVADAAPAKTPAKTVKHLFACVTLQPCKTNDVFAGRALKEWKEVRALLGSKLKVTKATLVATIKDPKVAAKWRRRWGKSAAKLAAVGFKRKQLLQLGDGRSVVRIAPGVALAYVSFDMVMGTRNRTERLLVTMIRQKDGWRVHLIEDSPGKHVSLLKKHKP